MKSLKRITRREEGFSKRISKQKKFERSDWLEMFPTGVKVSQVLARVVPKLEEKIPEQYKGQVIGFKRELKVLEALVNLKKSGRIHDYLQSGKWSFADLSGIDFFITFVDRKSYRVCSFSVTGGKWLSDHQKKHPDIPCIDIALNESITEVEKKILTLIKNDSHL